MNHIFYYELKNRKDDVVCKEGEQGVHFFIIETGELEVSVKGKFIKKLVMGSGFGELSLIHECPRTATVHVVSQEAKNKISILKFKIKILKVHNHNFLRFKI